MAVSEMRVETSERRVSTTGGSATTSTDSSRPEGRSTKSTRVSASIPTSTDLRTWAEKP